MHQNWMRDYDPTTGRYLQADPLGLVDGASVYGYALQNPMRFTDQLGLDVFVSLTDSAAGGFGHVGISTDQGLGQSQTEGWYASESAGLAACCGDVQGELLQDDMARVTRMLRIELGQEQTKRVEMCIALRRANPGHSRYNLFSNSCVDFVRDCLRAVGAFFPDGNRPDQAFDRLLRRGGHTDLPQSTWVREQ